MKMTVENTEPVGHDDIARLAKQIWEREGRQRGRDLNYWLQAERQLYSSRHQNLTVPDNRATKSIAMTHETKKAIRLPDEVSRIARTL